MQKFKTLATSRLAVLIGGSVLALGLIWPLMGTAQVKATDPGTHKHPVQSADAEKDLPAQLRELKAKVGTLEAALEKRYPGAVGTGTTGGKGTGMTGGKGMGMMGSGGMEGMDTAEMMQMMGRMMQMMGGSMKGMGGMQGKGMAGMGGMMGMDGMMMGGMGGQTQGMAGMSGMMDMDMMKGGQGMGGMGMMEDDMAMMGMMGKGSMGAKGMKMNMASALPGFPGASHVYHVGATDFFLDHPEHITLTTEQQTDLNRIKEKALLEKSTSQRKIDEAEQELWDLTGADEPDAKQIQAKVQEIEKLRGEQRLAFIRSVGEAAKVLTDEQRQVLLGQAKPDAHKAHPPATK